MEVLHISVVTCALGICLICIYALSPRAYISGKSLVPMLQLILSFVTIGVNIYMYLQATACIQSVHFLYKNHKIFIFIR